VFARLPDDLRLNRVGGGAGQIGLLKPGQPGIGHTKERAGDAD